MTHPPFLLRQATLADLEALRRLEALCFEPERRSAPRNLRRSLQSAAQQVMIAERGGQALGALVCLLYPRRLRIYSVCTHPEAAGQGIGRALVGAAEALARRLGRREVSLEAAERETRLTAWYSAQGYRPLRRLEDYYAPGVHAVRFVKILTPPPSPIG